MQDTGSCSLGDSSKGLGITSLPYIKGKSQRFHWALEHRQFTHFACVAHLKVSFKIALCKTPSHLPLASYSPEIISFKRALPVRGVAQESHEVWNKPHRHGSLQSFAHQSDEPAFQRGSAYYRPPLTHTAHEHSKGGADARDRDRGPLSQTWICSVICFGSKSSFSQWCLLF